MGQNTLPCSASEAEAETDMEVESDCNRKCEPDNNSQHCSSHQGTSVDACSESVQVVSDSESEGVSDIIPVHSSLSKSIQSHQLEVRLSDDDSDLEVLDGDDICRDVNNSNIYIRIMRTNFTTKSGKKKKKGRVYNRQCACPYCQKMVKNFSHHVLEVHKEKREVIAINKIQLTKKENNPKERKKQMKQRKQMIEVLRNKGNHLQNKKVLKEKKGEFIIQRRCKDGKFDVSKYLPCAACYEWLKISVLHRHKANCAMNKSSTKLSKGCIIVTVTSTCWKNFEEG